MNIVEEYNLALKLYNEGKLDTAKKGFLFCLSQKEDFFNAQFMLGNIYLQQQEYKQAITAYKKAIQLNPKYTPTYNNLANIYTTLQKKEKVLICLNLALKQNKKCTNTLYNVAKYFKNSLNLKKSKTYLKKLLKIDAHHALAHFDLSYIYFIEKKYKKAFNHFEYRTRISNEESKYNYLPFKHLENQPIKNTKLLLYHEQGFGDNIQFIRFLNSKKLKNTQISYAVQNPLNRLFSYSFPKINFLSQIDSNMDFKYDLPIMSLPHRLHINKIKPEEKYLFVNKKDVNQFKKDFLNKKTFNIGLVWKGSSTQQADIKRSVSLFNFHPIYNDKKLQFYSLQIENNEELNQTHRVKDLGTNFKDFYDTAVAIESLDLIISVDTAVAHLSGALGKRCFVLHNVNVIDFRWEHQNQKSLWYKSIKLFKYKRIEDIMDSLYGNILTLLKR